MKIPEHHPQRFVLNNEVHARPPEMLSAPVRLSFLALLAGSEARAGEHALMVQLAERYGQTPPAPDANHYSCDFGPFRIKWERHTEFTRYKFIVAGECDDPFAAPAIALVPPEWIASLPGQLIAAAHVGLQHGYAKPQDPDHISEKLFGGNALMGSGIAGGLAVALTDFRIHQDGFSRILVRDSGMSRRQAGRMIQRLLELDTYRMLALLALPLARELGPQLAEWEGRLVEITGAMAAAGEQDEPLLERLTRLSAAIESSVSNTQYRFSAATAYYELVERRIEELREERIQGLQTFEEFVERRLAPAMNTVRWVSARQGALSQRVARASQLLSTRVDIARERQNHALLDSMNRRAKLQLRLQETVEGLSVAAITYYVVGLVGYGAKALKAAGVAINVDLAIGISIPLVAIAVALGVRKMRRMVTGAHGPQPD
ncbi:MAG TPA: DUF3422 domain-containing protein [Burkholderiales bacterium]|nr:DUF3422 domain-containing protein [Burkholderiales bacterium]